MKKNLLVAMATLGLAVAVNAKGPSASVSDALNQLSQGAVDSAKSVSKETGEAVSSGYNALLDLFGDSADAASASGTWSKANVYDSTAQAVSDSGNYVSDTASDSANWSDANVSTPVSNAATSVYKNVSAPVKEISVNLSVNTWDASKGSAVAIIETESVQTSIEVSTSTATKLSDYTKSAVSAVVDASGITLMASGQSMNHASQSEFGESSEAIMAIPSDIGRKLLGSGDYQK